MAPPLRHSLLALTLLVSACGQFGYSLTGSALQKGKKPVTPEAASVLGLTGPDTIPLGRCSDAWTVTSYGASGKTVTVANPTFVTLAGFGDSNLEIYSDAQCTQLVLNDGITLATGTNSSLFYVRALHASPSTLTLSAAATNFAGASRLLTVQRVPYRLAWDPIAAGLEVNQCTSPLSFQFLDFENNPIIVANTQVRIAGAGGIAYTASSCAASLLTQGSDAYLNVVNSASGSFSIYVSSTGTLNLTVTADDPKIASDTTQVTIGASTVVTQLTMTTAANFSAIAGSCAPVPIRISAANSSGTVVNTTSTINLSVRFSAGSGAVGTACANAGQQTLSTSIGAGSSYREVYVTPSASGWSTLQATAVGAIISGATIDFNVQDPPLDGGLHFVITGVNAITAGTVNYYFVHIYDANNLPVVAPQSITVTISAGRLYSGMMGTAAVPFTTTNTIPLTIARGAWTGTVGLKPSSNVAQDFDLSATAAFYGPDSLHITVTP